jgi:hypothetical protein
MTFSRSDSRIDAVQVSRARDVALYGSDTAANLAHRGIQLGVASPRDVDRCALTHESLGGRESNPGISSSDEYDLSGVFGRMDVGIFRFVHGSSEALPMVWWGVYLGHSGQ